MNNFLHRPACNKTLLSVMHMNKINTLAFCGTCSTKMQLKGEKYGLNSLKL